MFHFLDHTLTRVVAFILGILLVVPWQVHGLLTKGVFLFSASVLLTFALMPLVIAFARKIDAMD